MPSRPLLRQVDGFGKHANVRDTPPFSLLRPLGRGRVLKCGGVLGASRVLLAYWGSYLSPLRVLASLRGGPSVCVCSPSFWRGPFGGFAGLGGAPPPVGLPPFPPWPLGFGVDGFS